MDYTQLTNQDVEHMLLTVGAGSIDDFFAAISAEQRVQSTLNIPAGLAEMELLADLEGLAGKNVSTDQQISFLGGGIYDHFVPTIVDALAMQSEFLARKVPSKPVVKLTRCSMSYEGQDRPL